MNDVVLLTGASGYLGSYLVRELEVRGLGVQSLGRHDCDLTVDQGDLEALATAVAEAAPRWVLNCAAMADVTACQEDPQLGRTNGKKSAPGAGISGSRTGDPHHAIGWVFDPSLNNTVYVLL